MKTNSFLLANTDFEKQFFRYCKSIKRFEQCKLFCRETRRFILRPRNSFKSILNSNWNHRVKIAERLIVLLSLNNQRLTSIRCYRENAKNNHQGLISLLPITLLITNSKLNAAMLSSYFHTELFCFAIMYEMLLRSEMQIDRIVSALKVNLHEQISINYFLFCRHHLGNV